MQCPTQRTFGRLGNRTYVTLLLFIGQIGAREQLGGCADDGEQIVEVMRDPAREPANRLHLLRLRQRFARGLHFLLGLPPLGQIARDLGKTE